MKSWHTYHIVFTTIFVICALNSWGSTPLPHLSFKASCGMVQNVVLDTVPAKAPAQTTAPADQTPVVDPQVTEPVTKRVPRSRKKVKPAPVTTTVRPPAAPVVKPKIVIKKITVKTPL